MTFADTTHANDIPGLNADLERRLGTDTSMPPTGPEPGRPTGGRRRWAPIALGALLCLGLGLGAGWLLFARGSDGPVAPNNVEEPVAVNDSQMPEADGAPGALAEPNLTLEDLFEQLPFEQGDSPLGDGLFSDNGLGDIPLDDFMSPDDVEQLRDLLEGMPSPEQLNELFGELEGQNLDQFLDPERLDEMNQLLNELLGQ